MSAAIGVAACSAAAHAGAFSSAENLVVVRCTNGGVGGAERVFLDEYNVSGPSPLLIQTIDLPFTGPDAFTVPNITSHDRHLHRSTDGQFLTLAGYNFAYTIGNTTDPSAESAATTPRVVGLVKFDGSLDLTTKLTDSYDATAIRGAFTTNGDKMWLSGDNLSGATTSGGVRFTNRGSSTSTNLSQVQTIGGTQTPDNIRDAAIFGGQLYDSSGSNASIGKGLLKVGEGLPETGAQQTTKITTDGISVSSFTFLDADPNVAGVDTVYTATSSPGTLRKYNLVGSDWVLAGAISGNGFDVEDVTARIDSTGQAIIFTHTKGGNIYRLTDATPYGLPLVGTLATPYLSAAAGFDFGGFDFAVVGNVGTWNVDSSGSWSVASNWIPATPNAIGATANFGTIITAARTVSTDLPQTVGTINFTSPIGYTIAGPATITINSGGGGGLVNVVSGNHAIGAPLSLSIDSTIDVHDAAALTISNLQPTAAAIRKAGAGQLAVNRVRAASLTVDAGTISILAGGSNSSTSRIGTLSIAGGATPTAALDLADNDLIVTSGSVASVSSLVRTARNNGSWTGRGITSSAARTQANHATTIGVLGGAEYQSVGGGTFDGLAIAPGDVLAKYTWYGDTDFNGVVNFDDYVRTDNGFNNHLSGWLNGDFDLNQVVNFDDYVLIDLAFNTQSGTLRRALAYLDGADRSMRGMDDPSLQKIVDHFGEFGTDYAQHFLSAVPEPTSLCLIGVAVLAGMSRRQRRQRRRSLSSS